ncbi:coat protein [Cherry virus Turkey]|nr:coat protein [Cherry virus Turkey]QCO31672.1 coat protein [Cherry virus Turkey]
MEDVEYEKNADGTDKLDAKGNKIVKKKKENEEPGSSGSEADLGLLRRRRPRTAFSGSVMTSSPGNDFYKQVKDKDPELCSMARDSQLKEIGDEWVKELKVPSDQVFQCAFEVTMYCVNNGSSEYTKFFGLSSCGVPLNDLASTIKSVTTLRQFCSRYAAIAWNYMLKKETPPANWQRHKVVEEAKYAAFDFFEAVTSDAAIMPQEGLVRKPTSKEMCAAAIMKDVKLSRDELKRGTNMSMFAEVTGGRGGPKVPIKAINQGHESL